VHHANDSLHWLPQAAEESTIAACGADIDGPCDKHRRLKFACRSGTAWTRSTDLEAYQHHRGEAKWPPPCEICRIAAEDRAKNIGRK
jgi:hypothetical protein